MDDDFDKWLGALKTEADDQFANRIMERLRTSIKEDSDFYDYAEHAMKRFFDDMLKQEIHKYKNATSAPSNFDITLGKQWTNE